MKTTITILALMVTLAAGCARQGGLEGFGELRRYEKANPDQDLRSGIERNDLRFKGLSGYVVDVPGVEDNILIQKYGVDVIGGTSDVIRSYEHGRLTAIARYYAEHYNMALARHINSIESGRISRGLVGYETVASQMIIEKEMTGEFNLLPYSFHASLASRTPRCVKLAWWFDPIKDRKPEYDWLQFLAIYGQVEEAACQHKWIRDWINAGVNRAVEAHIFGLRPYTESDFDLFVKSACSDAGLDSEPYYQLLLREDSRWFGTVYIGKDRLSALITHAEPKPLSRTQGSHASSSQHWLDSYPISYHPKDAKKDYIVVDQSGAWHKGRTSNTTKP